MGCIPANCKPNAHPSDASFRSWVTTNPPPLRAGGPRASRENQAGRMFAPMEFPFSSGRQRMNVTNEYILCHGKMCCVLSQNSVGLGDRDSGGWGQEQGGNFPIFQAGTHNTPFDTMTQCCHLTRSHPKAGQLDHKNIINRTHTLTLMCTHTHHILHIQRTYSHTYQPHTTHTHSTAHSII